MFGYQYEKLLAWLTLITSSGAWVCCALPILLTAIGFGSAVTALFGALPWLEVVETQPEGLLLVSALLIVVTLGLLFRPGRSCPITPELAASCEATFRWNKLVLLVSTLFWLSAAVVIYSP